MNVVNNKTGKTVLNMEGEETILPGATTDANEALVDALLNNYCKTIGSDWIYRNTTANIKGFEASVINSSNTSTVINNTIT